MKTITAAELMMKPFEPREDIVEDLIPKGVTLLVGKPKSGKSILALQVAVAVAEGHPVLGRRTLQGDVVYLALEDHDARLQERLLAMQADEDSAACIQVATAVDNAQDTDNLIAELKAWHSRATHPRLVIVDTLAYVVPERKLSKDEYQHAAEYLAKLRVFAAEHNLAVLLVHHTSKRDAHANNEKFDVILGTTGIFAAVDTAILMTNSSDSAASLAVRSRDVASQEVNMRHRDGQLGWVQSDDDSAPSATRSWRQEEVFEIIANAGTPLSSADLCRASNLKPSNLGNVLSKLVEQGRIVRHAKGHYTLASHHCEAKETVPSHLPDGSDDEVNEAIVTPQQETRYTAEYYRDLGDDAPVVPF